MFVTRSAMSKQSRRTFLSWNATVSRELRVQDQNFH